MSAFPVDDPRLDARLRDVCARFFVALRGASFGRCDLRVDRNGVPFMLEMNPNCGVYYLPEDAGSAGLCLAHDPEGHVGLTRRLIRAALQRHQQHASTASVPG
jgi:D-alanine-D-alanine ligase